MWFLQRWEPGSPTFNGARAIRLRGPLDVDALRGAFAQVIERHESLRTVFAGEREPVQVVLERWVFELEGLSSWWARSLEGAPELLRLPTDRPRPDVQRHEGAHRRFELDRGLGAALVELGREQGATFFMTMLAAFTVLLYRLSGEED